MSGKVCPGCASSSPGDFDDSSGHVACRKCGTIVDDSLIVSEIAFGENAFGAATVQGSFVAHGQSHARTGGKYRGGSSNESREASIAEGRRQINMVAAVLNCPDFYTEAAQRWFTLAVTNNFTKGRKSRYVTACCLYIACRMEKSSHMLIDFSDVLHINVFILGQTYLKLIKTLNIKLPNIDPTIYVHRFAKHLEFGQDQSKVAKDALRLIQRMNRDWIVQGRRPSGICGAALILAARMNNFRRSVREVVYVVKVADLTIHKRLADFRETKSADLTIEEFRNIWLEQAHDPPSFNPKRSKKRKKVREVDDDGEVIAEEDEEDVDGDGTPASGEREEKKMEPQRDSDGFVVPDLPDDSTPPRSGSGSKPQGIESLFAGGTFLSNIAESVIENEISSIVNSQDSADLVEQLRRIHRAHLESLKTSTVSNDPEDFGDIDDDPEIENCILSDREAEIKERIWTEYNKDWIRNQEIKKLKEASDKRLGIHKAGNKRRKKNKPRDSTSANMAASPAESAVEMMKRRAFSKKINYKAIEDLFDD
ncbi:BRF1-domain-containing protein [Ascodesmis nigricans]|uniref:B-related factor 1 n=1 Tax=Ascodesmis nigricans TaxID=341454 RepID=A0A4V3SJP8_9PEZI|nr:BRF1-domain-containing protein [Ascodesmis nigricans]